MEQRGLKHKHHLAPILGPRTRVSDVLNRKCRLSIVTLVIQLEGWATIGPRVRVREVNPDPVPPAIGVQTLIYMFRHIESTGFLGGVNLYSKH